jgi:hypothetical protein
MLTTEQFNAIIEEIATYKNVPVEKVLNPEMEGSDWGSCRVGNVLYMFDVTKTGKVRHFNGAPVRYYATVSDVANCIN